MPEDVVGLRLRDPDQTLYSAIAEALGAGRPVLVLPTKAARPVAAGTVVPQGTGWAVLAADDSWHYFVVGEDAIDFARQERAA